jgi:hypothetical protein
MAAAAGLIALFAFRLAFGLSSDFYFEDPTQIFLIGLRYYATGQWPFFGPDVVWTQSQIPGALQGLIVGLPFKVAALPESPFVLVNALSFAAICLMAWYLTKALPSLPKWLVYGWLLTVPWTLQFSTQIINPSWVLPAAIVFFVGFFEAVPVFTLGILRPATAYFMMGAGMMFAAQFHLSWPLFLPYAAFAWAARFRDGWRAVAWNALTFAAGAALPFAFVVPTLLRYGLAPGSGGTAANLHLHFVDPWELVTTLARLLSFASLEIYRFIATDNAKRLEFLEQHAWLVAPAVVVWLAGVVQPVWMLAELVRSPARWPFTNSAARWRALRLLVLASVVLVYVSYFFVIEPPQAHAFYVLAPIAFLLAACCWTFVDSPSSRRWAAAILAVNVAFHAGLALAKAPERSLYKDRDVVVAAIQSKRPDMLAHRRPFALDAGPYEMDQSTPHDPRQDIRVTRPVFVRRFDQSVRWTMTVENRNPLVAYRDLLHVTTYRLADGSELQRHELIKDIIQPCEVRDVEFNDGFVREKFVTATVQVVAAEALLPLTPGVCDGGSR